MVKSISGLSLCEWSLHFKAKEEEEEEEIYRSGDNYLEREQQLNTTIKIMKKH